jgi:deoxycytidylate deaminase
MSDLPAICYALINPLGVDTSFVCKLIIDKMKEIGYKSHHIKVSKYLNDFSDKVSEIDYHMRAIEVGNKVCEYNQQKDFIARRFVDESKDYWIDRNLLIMQSIKRPAEVDFLREHFGNRLFLLAITQNSEARRKKIIDSFDQGSPEERKEWASQCMQMDENGIFDNPYGQHVQGAFSKADLYLNLDNHFLVVEAVERFVNAVFNHPFVFPSIDEVSMGHAFVEKMRSGDTSRPVGVALVGQDGILKQVAYNEVPKAGGGVYTGNENIDGRDWPMKLNTSLESKKQLFYQVVNFLENETGAFLKEAYDENILNLLKRKTNFMDILEYSRNVHAEMNLIANCARNGIEMNGATIYSTTFPCHSCAKHIIASGIKKVVYIDPFAKSRALELFPDSITTKEPENDQKVFFQAYTGIAPQNIYFYLAPRREDSFGNQIKWTPSLKNTFF